MNRSGKFYYKNEREVMESLGLKQVKGSGNQWDSSQEDGENDFILCQLKSTDAQSIKVNQKDIRILEKNAMVSHKLPMFAIQFLNTGEVWLMCKPEDICNISEYIKSLLSIQSINVPFAASIFVSLIFKMSFLK